MKIWIFRVMYTLCLLANTPGHVQASNIYPYNRIADIFEAAKTIQNPLNSSSQPFDPYWAARDIIHVLPYLHPYMLSTNISFLCKFNCSTNIYGRATCQQTIQNISKDHVDSFIQNLKWNYVESNVHIWVKGYFGDILAATSIQFAPYGSDAKCIVMEIVGDNGDIVLTLFPTN